MPTLTHREMQVAAALYWRFNRKYMLGALEVRHSNNRQSDVALSNHQDIVEIECKSWGKNGMDDISRDIRKKKPIHDLYKSPKVTDETPNYYYFAVEPDLVEYAKVRIVSLNSDYGIMCIDADRNVSIVRRGKKLRDKISVKYYETILGRMSSMLFNYLESELSYVDTSIIKAREEVND